MILVGVVEQSEYGAEMQRCPDLEKIHNDGDGARYMSITKDLIRDFQCDEKGSWTEKTVKLPLPPEDSAIPEKVALPSVDPAKK